MTPVNDLTAYPYIYLESQINISRFYHFYPSEQVNNVAISTPAQGNIAISWDAKSNAEEYDVEWIIVNDYESRDAISGQVTYKGITDPSLVYDFERFGIRVTLSEPAFSISDVTDHGYLLVRVRPVGKWLSYPDQRVPGTWSIPTSSGTINDFNTNHPNAISGLTGKDADKNWQYVATYVEEGEKGEAMSIMDGSLRGRQFLAKIQSQDQTVVSQPIYDFHGRPAVSILPTPDPDPELKYRPLFNVNTNGDTYSWEDFDMDIAQSTCAPLSLVKPYPLGGQNGAGRYYSPSNPDKNGLQAYVPDAEGYPMSRTIYMPDRSGRIKSQGGAGPDHQPGDPSQGDNHDVRLYYEPPKMEDMDAIFGTEVGFPRFYTKTLSVDPNGQTNVVYKDAKGQVIATALLGAAPENLDALPSSLAYATKTYALHRMRTGPVDGKCWETSITQTVPKGANYTFRYDFDKDAMLLDPDCFPAGSGLDFLYKVTISVKDACGNEMLTNWPGTPTNPFVDLGDPNALDLQDNGSNTFNYQEIVYLEEGAYQITKTICLNEDAVAFYTQAQLDNSGCLMTYDDFREAAEQEEHTWCGEELEEGASYCESLIAIMRSDLSPGGRYGCVDPNDTDNWPWSIYNVNNQLASSTKFGSDYANSTFLANPPYAYTNPQIVFGALSGFDFDITNTASPFHHQGITEAEMLEEFLLRWEEDWVIDLLEKHIHPDACLMAWYCNVFSVGGSILPSVEFDETLSAIVTLEDAIAGGFIHDIATSSSDQGDWLVMTSGASQEDPYFTIAQPVGGAGSIRTDMLNYMDNYTCDVGVPFVIPFALPPGAQCMNIYQAAYYIVHCNDPNNPTASWQDVLNCIDCPACSNIDNPLFQDECYYDREWQVLKTLYLSLKRKFIEANMESKVCYDFANERPHSRLISSIEDAFADAGLPGISINSSYDQLDIVMGGNGSGTADPFTGGPNACEMTCAEYRDYWKYMLFQCDPALAGQPYLSLVKDILDGMQAICEGGCDETHPLGSRSLPSGSTITLNNSGLASTFNEVLLGYGVSQCLDLISTPAPFDQSGLLGGQQSPYPMLDACVCDVILQNELDFNILQSLGQLPDGVDNPYDLLIENYGWEYQDLRLATCKCNQAFEAGSAGIPWSPGLPWDPVSITYLADLPVNENLYLGVPEDFTCKVCVSCSVVVPAYNAKVQAYSGDPNFMSLIANTLNEDLDLNLTYWDYYDFAAECSNSPPAGCDLDYLPDMRDFMEDMRVKGELVAQNVDINDPSYVFKNTSLMQSCYGAQSSINYNSEILYNRSLNAIPNANAIDFSHINPTEDGGLLLVGVNDDGFLVVERQNSDQLVEWRNEYEPTGGGYNQNQFEHWNEEDLTILELSSASNNEIIVAGTWHITGIPPGPILVLVRLDANGAPLDFTFPAPNPPAPMGRLQVPATWNQSIDRVLGIVETGPGVISVGFAEEYFSPPVPPHYGPRTGIYEVTLSNGNLQSEVFDFISPSDHTRNGNEFISDGAGGYLLGGYFWPTAQFPISQSYLERKFYLRYKPATGTGWEKWFPTTPQGESEGEFALARIDNGNFIVIWSDPDDPFFHVWSIDASNGSISLQKQYELTDPSVTGTGVYSGFDVTIAENDDLLITAHYSDANNELNLLLRLESATLDEVNHRIRFQENEKPQIVKRKTNRFTLLEGSDINTNGDGLYNLIWDDTEINWSGSCDATQWEITSSVSAHTNSTNATTVSPPTGSFINLYNFNTYSFDYSFTPICGEKLLANYANAYCGLDCDIILTLAPMTQDASFEMLMNNGQAFGQGIIRMQNQQPTNEFLFTASYTDTDGNPQQTAVIGSNSCITLCTEPQLCRAPLEIKVDIEPDCFTAYQNFLDQKATLDYNDYINDVTQDLIQTYYQQAMDIAVGSEEIFTMSADVNEYHHTLYYYDQVGNLVKTVPPKGVAYLTGTDLAQVEGLRETNPNGNAKVPPHTFETKYRYNSLNQLVWKYTPDGGETYLWYDELGRTILSQDDRQRSNPDELWYTYLKYDKLGRAVESGEIVLATQPTPLTQIDYTIYESLLSNALLYREIVNTYYDQGTNPNVSNLIPGGQKNLRNRIASIVYRDLEDKYYTHATHFSYDMRGNAEYVIQEFNDLFGIDENFKIIRYEYDLLNGQTKAVYYQEGQPDQFIHFYEYDTDGRIKEVATTPDGVNIDPDAVYRYYDHGPLGRIEYGRWKVQGQDMAYNIHGWLKGVNAVTPNPTRDIGKDGDSNTPAHSNFARDAYGYTLGYYDGDYQDISGLQGTIDGFEPTNTQNLGAIDLFNGNIKYMTTMLADGNVTGNYMPIQATIYTYDQLNRIKSMNSRVEGSSLIPINQWDEPSPQGDYAATYSYDADGNLLGLTRTSASGLIDDFSYKYYQGKNQLEYVLDPQGSFGDDLDNQSQGNYQYDPIGNLVKDNQGEIDTIYWDHNGKIREIIFDDASGKPDLEFRYDAGGNRIAKIVKHNGTEDDWVYQYYVRDASGNVMAVYERSFMSDKDSSWKNGPENWPTTWPPRNGDNYLELFRLKEHHIYGSDRLGMLTSDKVLKAGSFTLTPTTAFDKDGYFVPYAFNAGPFPLPIPAVYQPDDTFPGFTLGRGLKQYELKNHLGNVLAVVRDRKLQFGNPLYYVADLVSVQDYYPFGMMMSGRSWQQNQDYRYGFQGQEQDQEFYDGAVSYKYRVHDPRIGRFLSIDPLAPDYPWNSPYDFSENMVIHAVELEGLEAEVQFFVLPVNASEFGIDHWLGRNALKSQGLLIELETVSWSTLNPGKEHGIYGTGTLLVFQRKSRPYSDEGEYDAVFLVYEKSFSDIYGFTMNRKDFPGIMVWGSGTGGNNFERDGKPIGTLDFAQLEEIFNVLYYKFPRGSFRHNEKLGGPNGFERNTGRPLEEGKAMGSALRDEAENPSDQAPSDTGSPVDDSLVKGRQAIDTIVTKSDYNYINIDRNGKTFRRLKDWQADSIIYYYDGTTEDRSGREKAAPRNGGG